MSPEALEPRSTLEPSADLFGLGEVLFFSLAGGPATPGSTLLEIAAKKASPPWLHEVAPYVTRPTSELVAELLAPDPKLRPDAVKARDRLRRQARQLTG